MEEKNLENKNVDKNLNSGPQEAPAPQEVETVPETGSSQIEFNEGVVNQEAESVSSGNMTTNQDVQEVKYAGFWIRWVAYFIDGIVISIISVPIGIVAGMSLGIMDGGSPIASFITGSLSWVIVWAYYIIMTSNYQATLGKMALGLRVVNDDLGKLSLGKVVIRETVGKFVSAFIIFIGYIMAGFTDRKRALHDMVSGSVVVYKDPNKKISTGIIIAIVAGFILFTLAVVGILASIVLVSLNSARDKAREAAVMTNLSSSVIAVIICNEEGGKITSPSDDGLICGASRWPNLSEFEASWGGCDEDIELSDESFQYCAKTSTNRLIRCTMKNGCGWDDGQGDITQDMNIGSDLEMNDIIEQASVEKSEYEIALMDIENEMNTETGAGSNMEAGAAALSQGDLVAAKQQFEWTNEKVSAAQVILDGVTPSEEEKDDYQVTKNFLENYSQGLEKMILGIDTNNDNLISEGADIIIKGSADVIKSAIEENQQ